jgi:flagellar basal-body rod protein FlgB
MQAVYLFDITSQHNQWLAARQSVIASNVANANTPGYLAADLKPFAEIMSATRLELAATAKGHQLPDSPLSAASAERRPASTWDIVHSGNSVSMEKELMKAGEVNGAYSLNTSVIKAFHRMMTSASSRGSS